MTISSPKFYDLEKVKIYAATKLGWIKKEQRKFKNQARETKRLMVTQESHYLFGARYLLRVVAAKRNSVQIKGKQMFLFVRDKEDVELKQAVLYRFYRQVLRAKLSQLVSQYAQKMELAVPEFKIRTMKTKWGSCAAKNERLWFNIELVKKPIGCIEYVVVHELVHLLERHHNKRFVLLMNQYYPQWPPPRKDC